LRDPRASPYELCEAPEVEDGQPCVTAPNINKDSSVAEKRCNKVMLEYEAVEEQEVMTWNRKYNRKL
jgi:hypothetical protein